MFYKQIIAYTAILLFACGFGLGVYRKTVLMNGPRNDFEERLAKFDIFKFQFWLIVAIAIVAVTKAFLKVAFGIVIPFL